MIGEFPAFILGGFGPLNSRVFRADLQPKSRRVVKQDADFLHHSRGERRSVGVLDRDRAFPRNEQLGGGQSLDGVPSCRSGIQSKKLPRKGDGIGLGPNPRHPQPQASLAIDLATFRLKIVGSPAIDSPGDLTTVVPMIVDVISGQQQAIEDQFSITGLLQRDQISTQPIGGLPGRAATNEEEAAKRIDPPTGLGAES